jgi:hypothetical protein
MPRKTYPFYPFLFGIFPALSLLSNNIGDARFSEIWLPLVIVVTIALIVWGALLPLLRDRHKVAILVVAFWIPFHTYGFFADGLKAALRDPEASPLPVLAVAAIIALFGLALFVMVFRTKRNLAPLSSALNKVGIFLIIVPLLTFGLAKLRQEAPIARTLATNEKDLSADERSQLPDIYYIIPDSYPRADILLETFDYDNTPFLEALEERGFYTVEDSYSNYPKTQMSLASSMNLDYLDPSHLKAEWNEALPNFVAQIWDNKVMDFLESYGYQFPTFSSGVAATEIDTGRFVKPDTFALSELQRVYIAMTPLRSPVERMTRSGEANRVLFVVEELGKVRRRERPMFVFAHMMSPHMPHSFDAEGRPVTETPEYYKGFRDETICLNGRFLTMIDRIQKRQPNSIIIIQGDHGCRSDWQSTAGTALIPWEGSKEDYIRDYTAVLNTIYFPDGDYSDFYAGITPVNTFRIIFNKYFGTTYELLPDKTYLSFQDGKTIEEVR